MRSIRRVGCGSVFFLLGASLASAGTFTFNASFNADDNQAFFTFVLNSEQVVTLQTTSAALGGFPTVVSLFGPVTDSNPMLLAFDDGPNPDSVLSEDLAAGSYLMVITEQDNTPTGGTNLLDPTLWADPPGTGNFTAAGGNPGPFVNPFNTTENFTGNLSVELQNVDSASQVPEPATLLSVIGGLGALAWMRRRRTR